MYNYRPHIPALSLVESCVSLAEGRNAWCVCDEFLILDIINPDDALERAKKDLGQAQDKGYDLESARCLWRIVRASKAKAVDLRFSPGINGLERGREVLDEAEMLVHNELDKVAHKGGEETAFLLLSLGWLNSHHRQAYARNEALNSALHAAEIAQHSEYRRLEAEALMLAAHCLLETQAERALGYADKAVLIFHVLGDKLSEGKAKHFVGMCRYHTQLRQESFQALEQALRLFREAVEVSAFEATLCEALELFTLAELQYECRRFRPALKAAGQATDCFKKQSYDRGWPASLIRLKIITRTELGEGGQAQQLGIDAIETYREQGENKALADVQMGLITSLMKENRQEAAQQFTEELLDFTRSFEDSDWEISALLMLAKVHMTKMDHDQARPLMEEARWLAQNENDDIKEWHVIEKMVRLFHEMNDYDQAISLLKEQQELCHRMGDKMREGWVLLRQCLVWGNKDDPISQDNEKAMQAAEQAKLLFSELNDKSWEASSWDKIAQAHIICFDDKPMMPDDALAAAKRARALHQKKGDKEREAKMLQRVFCRIYTEWGRHGESTKYSEEAVSIARGLQDKTLLPELLISCVKLRMDQIIGDTSDDSPPVLHGKEANRARRKAIKEAKEAYACARESEDKCRTGWFAWFLGHTTLHLEGLDESALEMSRVGAAKAVDCHDIALQAYCAHLEAEYHFMASNTKLAFESATKAMTLAQSAGQVETMAVVHDLIQQLEEACEADTSQQGKAGVLKGGKQMGHLHDGGDQDLRSGRPRGTRVDKESLMKVVAETAISDIGLGSIDSDSALFDSGVDSLNGVALRNRIQTLTGMSLPANMIYDFPTRRAIVNYLTERSNVEYTDA